jgi:hypothetical protein
MLLETLLVSAVVSSPLALLTAIGAHQRGRAMPLAVLAGLTWPVTWTVWYVKDEHPYPRTRHRAT